jgi:hypothetical protein
VILGRRDTEVFDRDTVSENTLCSLHTGSGAQD